MKISSIKIGARFRKDLGDLQKLADSIQSRGLLHPPVVTTDDELVCGFRRIKACELLGRDEVEVRRLDPDELLLAEHDENECRKEFTTSERVAIAKAIEERIGKRQGQRAKDGELVGNCPQVAPGEKTRDAAAKAAGFKSTDEYRRSEAVVEDGIPELVEAVEKGTVSVSAAAEVAKLPKDKQKEVVSKGAAAVKEEAKQQREKKKQSRSSTPLSGRTHPSANASDVQAGTPEHDEGDAEGEEAEATEKSPEPVPEADLGEVFVADVETLCRDMDKIAARIKAMKATPYAFSIHLDSAASQVEAARKTLWQGRPAHPCPYCRANEQVKPDCRACHGTSRVKKSVYDAGVDAVGGGR